MIQEVRVKNFLSYKEKVAFSFEATKDSFSDEFQVVTMPNGVRLIRFALIFGYNASGKSNLLKTFDFLGRFWNSKPKSTADTTGAKPFLLDKQTSDMPSEFEVVFYVQEKKYNYQVILDERNVYTEKLDVYETVQPTNLFERKFENGKSVISFGKKVLGVSRAAKEKLELECLTNASVFAARDSVNISIPIIDVAKQWLQNCFMPMISPYSMMDDFVGRQMHEDDSLSKTLVDFAHSADFNITNVTVREKKESLPKEYEGLLQLQNSLFPEKARALSESLVHYDPQYEHTVNNNGNIETYTLPYDMQSDGTRRMIGVETAINEILKHATILTVDEIESSLHPKLIEKVLFEYLKTNANTQLIVTTHNDGLLDLTDNLIRKDSIWFTEKQGNGSTDLYRLTDFKGLNRLSSIRTAYRMGRFGATLLRK